MRIASKMAAPRRLAAGGDMLEVGKKAPAFALPDEDGRTVRLADFKGRRVVVFFYPKANTSG
jgi:peroxiredoxin